MPMLFSSEPVTRGPKFSSPGAGRQAMPSLANRGTKHHPQLLLLEIAIACNMNPSLNLSKEV